MPFTDVWDITQPPDTQVANLLGQDLRNLKLDIMQRVSAMSGVLANRPIPETANANWTGLLYFSTDTNQIFQWSGAAWVDVSASFILKSPITLFFDNSVIVANGNTTGIVIPGNTLAVGSVIELTAAFKFNNGAGQSFFGFGVNGTAVGQNAASPVNPSSTSYGVIRTELIATTIGAAGVLIARTLSQAGPVNSIIGSALNDAHIVVNTTANITLQYSLATGGLVASLGPTRALLY